MATQPTSVDLAGLQQAINVFSNGVANFDGQYKQMTSTVSTIASNWTGSAYVAFDQALQNWLQDFSKVISVLNGMENALSQNTSVLTTTNDQTIQAAQRAAQGIVTPTLPGF